MTFEKPDLQDGDITACLQKQYALEVVEVAFLPSGDTNAAVYRVITADNKLYFLKLRQGSFDETWITVPRFLYDQDIRHIIAPIATQNHQFWTHLEDFYVILYPYVQGHNAFEVALTERQWVDFGRALKRIHTITVSTELTGRLPRETYSPRWREMVKMLQKRAGEVTFQDPIAAQWAEFMTIKTDEILGFVRKAERLGSVLEAQDPELVLCHSDIHAGNMLVDSDDGLYIVDWDNPILAPKERDLMFIGGGVGSIWSSPQEEAFFYNGYGQKQINAVALAYYRFERIVEDIASFGEQILLTDTGGKAPERWLQGFHRWFQPHDVVEMAYKSEKTLPSELQSP